MIRFIVLIISWMTNMKITIFKAGKGDSLLVEWNNNKMLVDSGTPSTINKKKNHNFPSTECLDFCIFTHIDYDHIGGFLKIISKSEANPFKKEMVIYGNCFQKISIDNDEFVGFKHGVLLQDELIRLGLDSNRMISGDFFELNGALLTVLSPERQHLDLLLDKWDGHIKFNESFKLENEYVSDNDKEFYVELTNESLTPLLDLKNDIINISSIAFLFEHERKRVMFLADSHPKIVYENVKKLLDSRGEKFLDVDLIKLSHHGSRYNTSNELLSVLKCNRFIISTDGSEPYNHPHHQTLSMLIASAINQGFKDLYLYFNYERASDFFILNEDKLNIKIHKVVCVEVIL